MGIRIIWDGGSEIQHVYTLTIEEREGEFATAKIETDNPGKWLNDASTPPYATIYSDEDADGGFVGTLFHGHLVGIPSETGSLTVVIDLLARPPNWQQKLIDCFQGLKTSPNYDILFTPEDRRQSPDDALEAICARYQWDRVSGDVRAVPCYASGGFNDMGSRHFWDGFSVRRTGGFVPYVDVTISCEWTQILSGIIDAGPAIEQAFSGVIQTYTPNDLEAKWKEMGGNHSGYETIYSALIAYPQTYKVVTGEEACNYPHYAFYPELSGMKRKPGATGDSPSAFTPPWDGRSFSGLVLQNHNDYQPRFVAVFADPSSYRGNIEDAHFTVPTCGNEFYVDSSLYSYGDQKLDERFQTRPLRIPFTTYKGAMQLIWRSRQPRREVIKYRLVAGLQSFAYDLSTVVVDHVTVAGVTVTVQTSGASGRTLSFNLGDPTYDYTAQNWMAGQNYAYGGRVTVDGLTFRCTQAHTSLETFLEDCGGVHYTAQGSFTPRRLANDPQHPSYSPPSTQTPPPGITGWDTATPNSLATSRQVIHALYNQNVASRNWELAISDLGAAAVPRTTGAFFRSDRGQQAFAHSMLRARSVLAYNARCVEVTAEYKLADIATVTCASALTIHDGRIAGGVASGKVISYSLHWDGDSGIRLGRVTIACVPGVGGDLTLHESIPDVASDYGGDVAVANNQVIVGGDIAYAGYAISQTSNSYEVDMNGVVQKYYDNTSARQGQLFAVTVKGTISEQQSMLESYTRKDDYSPTTVEERLARAPVSIELKLNDLNPHGTVTHTIFVPATIWNAPKNISL